MLNNQKSLTDFSYITQLTCSDCGKEYSIGDINTYCLDCQSPLLANYNLNKIRQSCQREEFYSRPRGMWRWHELLPVQAQSNCITLGEGDTPLLHLPRLGEKLGLSNLFIKDESNNPTGSL
jgi:threonine synthase